MLNIFIKLETRARAPGVGIVLGDTRVSPCIGSWYLVEDLLEKKIVFFRYE